MSQSDLKAARPNDSNPDPPANHPFHQPLLSDYKPPTLLLSSPCMLLDSYGSFAFFKVDPFRPLFTPGSRAETESPFMQATRLEPYQCVLTVDLRTLQPPNKHSNVALSTCDWRPRPLFPPNVLYEVHRYEFFPGPCPKISP